MCPYKNTAIVVTFVLFSKYHANYRNSFKPVANKMNNRQIILIVSPV